MKKKGIDILGVSPQVGEKIRKKLEIRLEEAQKKTKENDKLIEKENVENSLLENCICPRCGGDVVEKFLWTNILFMFVLIPITNKKMKCLSCGFTKIIREERVYY